ncbi:cytochrome P450 18a1-like [Stegodyphus dumicola]|uniref:cytochrome P450 18a1-like n=1 Tax=Stegodyphus dumicola TaxID=202533 RepID=UPI0015A9B9F6|nr:cytochrome P450 18a1-like [Stegodyphus dumicola]
MAFNSINGILKDAVVVNKIDSNVVLLLIILLCTIIYLYGTKKKYKLPPGPIGLPILGYLPFLGKEPHKTLSALAKKYGNVFGLYFGRQYAVVINEWTAVREAFGQSATTDKPPNFFDLMPNGLGFSGQNGSEWAEQRRFAIKAMKDVGLGRTRWEELVQVKIQ